MRRREAAFAEVVRRHGGMVLSVCRSVLGNTTDAEDAAQAVFLTLAKKAHASSVQNHLVGWLHRVAWYVAARGAEAKAIRRRHEQEAARMKPDLHAGGPEAMNLEVLHAGLAKLPEKYRVPLILHHIEGRSLEETAALMGCTAGALAVRLHRGREMLRQRMPKKEMLASAAFLAGGWGVPPMMPPMLAATTAKAATALLTGPLTTAVISGQTLSLTKGAMHMLLWANIKAVAIGVAMVLFVGGVVGTVIVKADGTTSPHTSTQTTTQPSVYGSITAVGTASITLQTKDGAIVVATDSATVVKLSNPAKTTTTADLKVGMRAIAFGPTGQAATEIRAYIPGPTATQPAPSQPAVNPGVYGTITAVANGSMTLQTKDGSVVVTTNSATVVKLGNPAVTTTTADLKVGMHAMASGPKGQAATEIRAYMPGPSTTKPAPTQPATTSGVFGTITALADGSITLQTNTGSVVVTTNSATVVKLGNPAVTTTTADLKIGMHALANGPKGQPATEIKAYMPGTPTSTRSTSTK